MLSVVRLRQSGRIRGKGIGALRRIVVVYRFKLLFSVYTASNDSL